MKFQRLVAAAATAVVVPASVSASASSASASASSTAALLLAATAFSSSIASASALDISVPHAAVTSADAPLAFSSAKYNAITLADGTLDVPGGDAVTLSVDVGKLTLGQTSGLTFTTGDGVDDTSMTFSGDVNAVNSALDGLVYHPPANTAGRPALTLSVTGTQSVSMTVRIAVNAILDVDAARAQLTAGVTVIHSGQQPGKLVCYGAQAAPIIMFSEDISEGPMIGAASWGNGRAVAMPDHQMLKMGSYGDVSGQFYKNAIAWLAKTTTSDLSVSIVTYDSAAATWLTSQGYTDVATTDENNLVTALASADVFIGGWMGTTEPAGNLDALEDFCAVNGKGLFIADYGHGYSTWWNKPYHKAPGNLLLREAGLGFGEDYKHVFGEIDATHVATGAPVTAEMTLDMLNDRTGYTDDQLDHGGHILDMLFAVLPEDDPLLPRMNDVFLARINTINPTPDTPVTDGFDKALLGHETELLASTPPNDVTPHRTVEDVYGTIPVDAPRIASRTVSIDMTRGRWQATGMYVVPGEVVTVTAPPELIGHGYRIRINAHTDNISKRDTWIRPPSVHRYFTIDTEVTHVANAFGGAIFIDLLGKQFSASPGSGAVDVTIANAIEHPYFVLGVHTDDDWNSGGLKDKPAPYAVFVAPKFSFVQRSSEHSSLTKPTELMTYWNDMVNLQDDLSSRTGRTSGELVNVDIENSAGSAHAGYPIQAYDRYWGNLADLDHLKLRGSWGNYHEVGHNMQRGWWTWSGQTEVTNNIFSAYCLINMPTAPTTGWSWSTTPLTTMDKGLSEYTNGGIPLSFWMVQAHWFGFPKIRDTFATYEYDDVNNPVALPDGDQEERGQWYIRFSQQVGHDMTRYMVDTYGLDVSQDAKDQVSAMNLPDWMPAYPGISGTFSTVIGSPPIIFDLRGEAKSFDGGVTVEINTPGAHGTVSDNGDGTWSYTPDVALNSAVVDSFVYSVVSSTGHKQNATITLDVMAAPTSSPSAAPTSVPTAVPTTSPTSAPTVVHTPVDLSDNKVFVSREFGHDDGVSSSAYFVTDDPAIGPTTSKWWGGSDITMNVPLVSTCNGEDVAVTASVRARQKVCNSHWQMNAGRSAGTCPHSLVLELRDSSSNPWLINPDYGLCNFRTAPNSPVKIIAKSWHADHLYEEGIMGEMLLTFSVSFNTPDPTSTPTAGPTSGPTAPPTKIPTSVPTKSPTGAPTASPTKSPTSKPTDVPTKAPTSAPTVSPTSAPTKSPTDSPTSKPTDAPTKAPTSDPTVSPTGAPTKSPSDSPTASPTAGPTVGPTGAPTKSPINSPTLTPTSKPTSEPTVDHGMVDLSNGQVFTSQEFSHGDGVSSSAYFVTDDPAIGPTTSKWWGGSRENLTLPLISSCLGEGETVTATVKAQQQVCNSKWQMNAGRSAGTCSHALRLQMDDSTVNTWLADPSYGNCEFHTAPNSPVKIIAKSWHADHLYEDGEIGELLLTFTVFIPTESPTSTPTTSPTSKPTSSPTKAPTSVPTVSPTSAPTKSPTNSPTSAPTSNPTSEPTVHHTLVDLSRGAEFISQEFGHDVNVSSSAYFVTDDPAIGPTTSKWWGGSRETLYLPLASSCLAEGETVTATVQARQKVCNSKWQMNAGRSAGTCAHSLVLQMDDSIANPWLVDPNYGSCEFHTAPNSPVKIIAKSWHADHHYEDGEMGEMLLAFTVTTMPPNTGAVVETWYGIDGSSISSLTSDPRYPDNPNTTHVVDILETAQNRGSSFGTRMRCLVVPPATGDYTFWIATDDHGELWLSTDDDPLNKELIASVSSRTGYRQWDKYASQQSVAKSLLQGERYYLEALQKEGGSSDSLSVAWEGGGITQSVIDGIYTKVYSETRRARARLRRRA